MIPGRFWQQVYITNILSLIFSGLTIIFLAILIRNFGWGVTSPFILGVAFLFLMIVGINGQGYHKAGRLIFCIIPVWLTMFITVYMKIVEPQSYVVYFDARYVLLAGTILPAIVFRMEEKFCLVASLVSIGACLLLFDPIHEMFSVGYYQKGFDVPAYSFINYIVAISFVVISSGMLLLRSMTEQAESKLQSQNIALRNKQAEIEIQHDELFMHREELLENRERLEEANRIIHRQKSDLEKYNLQLVHDVKSKSAELIRTNEELLRRNNELTQFSYTVSHNLRGPVARLLGLTDVAKRMSTDDQEYIGDLIARSAQDLDGVLKDLGHILDLRNELSIAREEVSLQYEWERSVRLLSDQISGNCIIQSDFGDVPMMMGVKAMFQSIFYNLLSNALKYQSPHRTLFVQVNAFEKNDHTELVFSDNGIGIDLNLYGKDLFKLYKRFHPQVQGKGLGLYLVRMQVESMEGEISVESKPDAGTVFTMKFRKVES
jgi:signal transduction histidine kinase